MQRDAIPSLDQPTKRQILGLSPAPFSPPRQPQSFALKGVVAIDGGGKNNAPQIAEHLLDIGYQVLLLLDSDAPPNPVILLPAVKTARSAEIQYRRGFTRNGTLTQWVNQNANK